LSVLISRQGDYLIASVVSDLSDSQVVALRAELVNQVGDLRSRGIIVDVGGLDVIDSFVARSLRSIALTMRLRGAETVVVGIQPEVAIAMVQFDLDLDPIRSALDIDEAFLLLEQWTEGTSEDGR
jgi:rsbT antagonist protein RsbS